MINFSTTPQGALIAKTLFAQNIDPDAFQNKLEKLDNFQTKMNTFEVKLRTSYKTKRDSFTLN